MAGDALTPRPGHRALPSAAGAKPPEYSQGSGRGARTPRGPSAERFWVKRASVFRAFPTETAKPHGDVARRADLAAAELNVVLRRRKQQQSHYLRLDYRRICCFAAQVNGRSSSPGLLGSCSDPDGAQDLLFGDGGGLRACGDSSATPGLPPLGLSGLGRPPPQPAPGPAAGASRLKRKVSAPSPSRPMTKTLCLCQCSPQNRDASTPGQPGLQPGSPWCSKWLLPSQTPVKPSATFPPHFHFFSEQLQITAPALTCLTDWKAL